MIGGITKGSCFSGCVEYALALKEKNKEARLLYSEGLLTDTPKDIIDGFECQRHLNSRVQHWCGHISLSYSPKDAERMYNRENETCTILKRNEQIFSFFASFFLLLFRPLKHHFNAD